MCSASPDVLPVLLLYTPGVTLPESMCSAPARPPDVLRFFSIWAYFWTYVDDITVQAAVQDMLQVLRVVEEALASMKCTLQPRKCVTFVPAVTMDDQQECEPALRRLADFIPVSTEGITLLGTDASGERALPLGPWAATAEPTRKRGCVSKKNRMDQKTN